MPVARDISNTPPGQSPLLEGPIRRGRLRVRPLALVGVMLVVLVLFTMHTVSYVEGQMKDQLLTTGRLVGSSLSVDDIKQLTFSPADSELEAFARLRKQMVDLAQAIGIKSVYSQVLRDGRVVFGPESIPTDSPMSSSPGTFYYEAPPQLYEAFSTGQDVSVGPFSDEYGTFVSAFVPVSDPASGKVLMVVGLDVEATDWNTKVALRAALPLALMVVLMVLIASIVASAQPIRTTSMPAMRLMTPLAALMLALVCVFGAAMWTQYVHGINQDHQRQIRHLPVRLEQVIQQDAAAMTTTLKMLAAQSAVRDAMERRDADSLLSGYQPLYEFLHQQGLDHFYFIDAQGVCLLRLHNPPSKGDVITRTTLRHAKETLTTAAGLELGPHHDLTLRVVEPIFAELVEGSPPRLLGFVELGCDIQNILDRTREDPIHLAVLVHKEILERQTWETSRSRQGKPAVWDRFPNDVMMASTLAVLPRELERPIASSLSRQAFNSSSLRQTGGQAWQLDVAPLTDITGNEIGHLLAISDITTVQGRQNRLAILSLTAVGVTLAVLFGFLYAMLRRTDRGIAAQRAELERERRRLANVLEGTSAGLWEWNMQTGQTVFNERWAQMIGYTLLELEPLNIQTWQRLCHPDDLIRSTALIESYLTGKSDSYICECRIRHKDGRWIWVMDRGKVVEWTAQGEPLRMAGTHVDVTSAKTSEIAVEEHRRFLRQIIDQVPSTILVRDEDGRILLANQALADMLGAPVDKVEGHCVADFLEHCSSLDATLADDALVMQQRRVLTIPEQTVTATDGYTRWFTVVKVPLVDESDRCRRVLTVATDITHRKQMQDELLALNQQLSASSRVANQLARDAQAASIAKSEFLANMSHEIRTPMTAILGFADLLSEGELPPEQRDEYLSTIKRNGEHLLSIINDILDLSKIEAGKMTVESVPTNPSQILQDVAALMGVKAQSKGLTLQVVEGKDIPPSITSDPVRLRQILVNLVGNAIKFTESGSITVTSGMDRNGKLRFQITDTGIGMTSEQVSRLFNAFEQADASTTRRYGGTGLGLRISKRLASLLGGDLIVQSQLGHGSTFSVSLATGATTEPRQSSPTDAPRIQSGVGDKTSLAGLRVLLADDGPDNLKLVSFILRYAGATVHTVENGRLAVEYLTADHTLDGPLASPPPVDLVLTDMQMPIMDGYTAARTLRQKGWTLPILALTAHSMSGDLNRCLEAGCDDYASKPIDRQALINICVKWWRRADRTAPPAEATPQAKPTPVAPPENSPAGTSPPLHSTLVDDPVVGPVIHQFVDALPRRLDELNQLLSESRLAEVARFAHQIKGAAGGFGFQSITDAAYALEQSAAPDQDLEQVKRRLAELEELVRAAVAGMPREPQPVQPTPQTST